MNIRAPVDRSHTQFDAVRATNTYGAPNTVTYTVVATVNASSTKWKYGSAFSIMRGTPVVVRDREEQRWITSETVLALGQRRCRSGASCRRLSAEGTTLRSIGHIGRLQHVLDNDADYITPLDMLAELRDDNKQLAASMRETHSLCDEHGDVATASLLEVWIDEAERRTWFLFEASRSGEQPGR
jgi:hypothetical protein